MRDHALEFQRVGLRTRFFQIAAHHATQLSTGRYSAQRTGRDHDVRLQRDSQAGPGFNASLRRIVPPSDCVQSVLSPPARGSDENSLPKNRLALQSKNDSSGLVSFERRAEVRFQLWPINRKRSHQGVGKK